MHALQNYGEEEPGFDGNTYSYSSTYHAGHMKLFVHHVTPPTVPGMGAEYHMTQIKAFAMTSDRDTFVQGATAFRNTRDLAQRHRDRFVQTANIRACQPNPSEAQITVVEIQQYEASTCDEFVDCEDYVKPQAVGAEHHAISQGFDDEPDPPYAEDEKSSQDSASADTRPAIGFTVSFPSSFSVQSHPSSKRNRASYSPPSKHQPHQETRLSLGTHWPEHIPTAGLRALISDCSASV